MTPSWRPPSLPSRLAASRHLPIVGRDRELETLEALWADVEAGRRQLLFVGGEPGTGKSRLLAEAAGALHDNGVTVLVGGCSVDAAIPYQPFTEMLDHLFATTDEGALTSLMGADIGRELLRLSPHVIRHRAELRGADDRADVPDARRDLFDAVATVFRGMAAERPLTLVLDDLQWAQIPTIALLEHVVQACPDSRMLVLAAFRTTAPDRSDEVTARVVELHRLEGVRRLDLSGLDTEAIAEYVSVRSGLALAAARAPAALLRDRTGGNAFFLRELWGDVERRGGVSSLRFDDPVPMSIADAISSRLSALPTEVQRVLELGAVLGDTFDVATLVAASDADRAQAMAFVDAATAVGLIEATEPDGRTYAFVHALVRQTVIDRLRPSRRAELHARAATALERQSLDPALVPRLAAHYLAASVLGYHDEALAYCRDAGRQAESSLAFEEAAAWFERAASLPDCDAAVHSDLLLAAAHNHVRACDFPRARDIYERLTLADDPLARLAAAMGYEDASWRPGVIGSRAADLLSAALAQSPLPESDPRHVRGLASLGRALAFAGEVYRAREVGARAIELARLLGDDATLAHAITASLWHGTTPEMLDLQLERATEVYELARAHRDFELLGSSTNFRAMAAYLRGQPDDLEDAISGSQVAAEATGQPYFRYVAGCLSNAAAFMRGDFAGAERWARETRKETPFGDEMAEGPYGVQMFMIQRERGALEDVRRFIDGSETFEGRWLPALLALYTELGVERGMRRALTQLMDRQLTSRPDEAQWSMELVFMIEGALALKDVAAARILQPLLEEYAGMNLFSGTLIAVFGSTDRYQARIAALLGDDTTAERHFVAALEMDRRMRSSVHVAETLMHHALFLSARGDAARAHALAQQARDVAAPIGQLRVLRTLETLTPAAGPDGLSDREVEVLRLLATGLSNQEIGSRLHISTNTAANHVRSILMKTGSTNRTQAALYAAQRQLV